MATFNSAVQSLDVIQHHQYDYDYDYDSENDMTKPMPPRVPLSVPSDPWVPCYKAFAGCGSYAPSRYSSGLERAASDPDIRPDGHYRQYECDFSPYTMITMDPIAQQSTPDETDGGADRLESPKLTATAQSFVPAKSSKLDATAPSFLLSRLAIFDPPADGLTESPRKCTLVLPNARDDNITDSIEMMQCPQNGQVGRFTYDTTLKFNNGWHRNDPVLAAMYHIIGAKKKMHFGVFVLKHAIRPVNDAPPLWPPGLNIFNTKSYYFKSKTHNKKYVKYDKEETSWITILPNGSPPTAKTIHIYEPDEKKWVVFGGWLDKISESQAWLGRTGYSLQFNWWKYSGSKRRFIDLPAELRVKIYRYALGGEVYPLSTSGSVYGREVTVACRNARLTLGLGYHRRLFCWDLEEGVMSQMSVPHVPETRSFVYEPALELLRVSSWMHDEVLHTGWELMRSCFFDPGIFHKAINSRAGSAMAYKCLSKVELAFTNHGWFDFLGVKVSNDEPYISVVASESLGPSLSNLGNLKDLRLRFRPLDDGHDGSPWGNHAYVSTWTSRSDPYVCCQRTTVDWICTFACPFLIDKCKEGKVKVTLTGAVKTDTKTKWEKIFANELDHDHEAAIASILDTQMALPPNCQCTSMCSVGYFNRRYPFTYFQYGDNFDPDS